MKKKATTQPERGTAKRAGEFALIRDVFAPLTHGHPGALGLTDDAALLEVPEGAELVVTADALAQGVHFRDDDPPADIARKLLRVNLSDLAAKGARPLGYVMTCAWAPPTTQEFIEDFAAGLDDDFARFGVPLLGGDTLVTKEKMSFSLTAFGFVARGTMLRRAGARPGNLVYVSGSIGDAYLGLELLEGRLRCDEEAAAYLTRRYRLPEPRLDLGQRLVGCATACIDVSDGLVADAAHIAETSGAAICLSLADVPLSKAARASAADPVALVTGGDDYELLFTLPPEKQSTIEALAAETGLPLTRIGRVTEGSGVTVLDAAGKAVRIRRTGYEHL